MTLRLVLVAIGVAILTALGISVSNAYKAKGQLALAETALTTAAHELDDLRKGMAKTQALQGTYENELSTLRAGAAVPPPVVRVCRPTTAPVLSRPAPGPSSDPTATAGPRELRTTDASDTGPNSGPDIGPALIALSRDADLVLAQCRVTRAYALDVAHAVP